MLTKNLRVALLAGVSEAARLQTTAQMHHDICVVEHEADMFFSDVVEWTNKRDKNMKIVKERDSLDANILSLEICFAMWEEDSIAGKILTDSRIQGFAAVVEFEDETVR